MKSTKELKNSDIIEINGEKFQVITNTSLWQHMDKNELEMVVELVKIGEKHITPNYRLTYIYEQPEKRKFFAFDMQSKKWKEIKINSIKA